MSILSLLRKIFARREKWKSKENIQSMKIQQVQSKRAEDPALINPIVALDIGCRWGFAERFISNAQCGNFKVYGFDPDQEECHRLQASYHYMPPGFVTCIAMGLAGKNGRRNLHVTKDPACSSLHPPIQFLVDNYPALKCITPKREVKVSVITLKQWAEDYNVNVIDYIKIDTQGSELEILKGADDILHLTRCIDIEVEFNPIYEGQTLFGETDTYLRAKGFQLWRLSNLVHYSLGGDALVLGDPNTIFFDDNQRQEMPAYGGQLFWADAKYVHSNVFMNCNAESMQTQRDIILFKALGLDDVVDHIERLQSII